MSQIETNKNILVSIITVTYNSEKTLFRTIESVLHQTYDYIEYIIVDGNSSDDTLAIVQKYEPNFSMRGYRYRVLSESDKGMYDALNKGAKLATGTIVGQINSDDWYEPDAVKRMVKLYQDSYFDMAYANLRMINPDGSSWIKESRIDSFVNTRHWNHPTQFTKRALLLEHPYPNECMSDDLDLLLWIRSTKKHIEILDYVIANFTIEGMSHSKGWKDILDRIKTKSQIYHRYGYSWLHSLDVIIVESGKYILEIIRSTK